MSNDIILRNGTLVGSEGTTKGDLRIRGGRIVGRGDVGASSDGDQEFDVSGCLVGPGFVDLHTHLREPGREEAETIASGAMAAALGGFTAIVAMPNTEPALDNVITVSYVLAKGAEAVVDVAVAAAITVGRAGEHLTAMSDLAALGVRLFTDDGSGVQSAAVMRRAMSYAAPLGITLAQHCEDESLAAGGVMNEGALSSQLGLAGRPAVAEELMVMRDIELSRLTKCPVHFLHLSTARSVALVAAAKAEGLLVTCEIAPHHFTLDESSLAHYDTQFKVHPPLRTASDVAALRSAMTTGIIDAVATDHAPHASELKDLPFDQAPAGMLGLEQVASLTWEALGENPDPVRFFALLSRGPARIAQLRDEDSRVGLSAHGGELTVGDDANIVVFDPRMSYVVDRAALASRAHNTPYHGRAMHGRAVMTLVRGTLVARNGELQ